MTTARQRGTTLNEGRRSCGAHMTEPKATHNSPSDSPCSGTLGRFSLGHELVTDVVRLQFPGLHGEWAAYSVAYAMLLGAAETLDVPDTDLNATIAGGTNPSTRASRIKRNVHALSSGPSPLPSYGPTATASPRPTTTTRWRWGSGRLHTPPWYRPTPHGEGLCC